MVSLTNQFENMRMHGKGINDDETKQDEKFNNLTSLYRAILNFSLLHLEETINRVIPL